MSVGKISAHLSPLRELSADQQSVLRDVLRWHRHRGSQVITIGGYAGTGKTTLIGVMRNELETRRLGLRVALASYTGKASRVLGSKIREAFAEFSKDYIGTIHGLIYTRRVEEDGKIVGWKRRESLDYDLIIIDEASMVDEAIWNDLLSFDLPIVAVGDHGQLPPVHGEFNLMKEPNLELVHIHRQAAKNPILRLSQNIRRRGRIPEKLNVSEIRLFQRDGHDTEDAVQDLLENWRENTLVLCGSNGTRVKLNRRIRRARGWEGDDPLPGDRVICLRNNWNAVPQPVCNGMLGTIERLEPDTTDDTVWRVVIRMDDEDKPYAGRISKMAFNQKQVPVQALTRRKKGQVDYFDFGYALTVHKAQGSEADRVVVFAEKLWSGDVWKRWLYTAVTRAREQLVLIY